MIIEKAGLNPKDVLLIRHAKSEETTDAGQIKKYTSEQKPNMPKNKKYWMVFLSDKGTSAKFHACYLVNGCEVDNTYCVFQLDESDEFSDLKNRLIIDWGHAARSWYQYAHIHDKEVIAIQANPKYSFSGYENLVLTYNELKEIIKDQVVYENWHTALKSVNAIYLIVDTGTGKQYVGSAYGDGGLLSRWACYIESKHGNNKKIIETLCQFPERYQYFQFSILQILPRSITNEEVIQFENLYKQKLMSKAFGMNGN
jgi:hypothetical protein